LQLRRADDALHFLLRARALSSKNVVSPEPISYLDLGRVHSEAYLETLQQKEVLAHIFAVDASDLVAEELLRSIRLACGGTLEAARYSLAHHRPGFNLAGGFHHAAPNRGAGFCAVNDVAVAIRVLRAEGFEGRVAVLDFDFHPPDGTAECLGNDDSVWLASISGADWGTLEGVDETRLPAHTHDADYLLAVDALLSRMPHVDLAFVIAGGDVLSGDVLGTFDLSLQGIARRDVTVARKLGRLPQVWLPAGGYSPQSWKVLAGTGLALAFHSEHAIPSDYNPTAARLGRISASIPRETLGSDDLITEADVAEAFGMPRVAPRRFLDFYSRDGLEQALEKLRLLALIRRLGYSHLRVAIERKAPYDRGLLYGVDTSTGREVKLVELEVQLQSLGERRVIFINWLSLRNPRARFSAIRPRLPGQEVPGLGLAAEMAMLMTLMAKRLGADGVAFRPSWYHMAWTARHVAHFVDARRQGRFDALMRDLKGLSLLEASKAVAEGRVLLDGRPYVWEADEMVRWLEPSVDPQEQRLAIEERERCHFSMTGAPGR
jgi:acetoin utilization deacetylase AcuC-like enzyme